MTQMMENRVRIIFTIVVILTVLYTIQGVFVTGVAHSIEYDSNINTLEGLNTSSTSQSNLDSSKGDIIGILTGLFNFAFFQIEGAPDFVNVFMGLFIAIIIGTLILLVMSYVYDFVKALPFT